jgi:hypothetical protein
MNTVPEPLHPPSLPVARHGGCCTLPAAAASSSSCGMSALHADAAHRDLGSSPTWPARKCVGRLLVGLSRLSSASRRPVLFRSSLTGTWSGAISRCVKNRSLS